MALTCNIDARGKVVRLVSGATLLVIGLVMLFLWALRSDGAWPWVVTVAGLAGGAFAVFEARAGWCVVRAMGFKTPV